MKYEIYQVKKEMINKGIAFKGTNMMRSLGLEIDINNYNKTYEKEVPVGLKSDVDDDTILESLFILFNVSPPEDFKGRSMSVSDIVILKGRTYFCDTAGWTRLYNCEATRNMTVKLEGV